MDLRESMWDSAKVFHEGLHVQLAAKLFCLENFMVYSTFGSFQHTGNSYMYICQKQRSNFIN